MRLGPLVGAGRTAHVFEFGAGSVIKLLRPEIPMDWAETEARLTAAVHARGLPTPAVRDVLDVDGRAGIVFERIDGPSMWSQMTASTKAASDLGGLLASMHLELLAERAPESLPSVIDRIVEKTAAAEALTEAERGEAGEMARSLDEGSGLCHGDMHPGNVLMSGRGPILIDWYDAAAGSAIADVVRTSLLVRPPIDEQNLLPHLPGATTDRLCIVHRRYLEAVVSAQSVSASLVRAWEPVLAASRLAERAEPNDSHLVALWRDRQGTGSSALLRELDALGALDEDGPQ